MRSRRMWILGGLDTLGPEELRRRHDSFAAAARARKSAPRPPAQPAAIEPARIIWRDTVPGGWYRDVRLKRGQALRIVNFGGSPGVSVLLWNADDTTERFYPADTMKIQWNARLTAGNLLLSEMGRVMASIIADSSGQHDAIVGCSTSATNARRYGDATLRNSRDNFCLAAGKFGLGRRDMSACITFFAGVQVRPDGHFAWIDASAGPGEAVDLRAEMDLLIALSNCPHPLSPDSPYNPKPIEIIVWNPPPPGQDDPCRTSCDEAARAFENTDAFFAR